ncbi:MAG: HAMP domain-containing histidine kinase, partial [Candidatus Sericytochromatia bacterium]|nr:HAMP domain-containing histidine kinase [Candidatus Sericytochromatia bacterium]
AMPDLGEMLADAAMAAQRMAVIVKDLRLFSRVEAAPTTLVDVRSVLDRTARIARNEILHRARLTKHYEDVPLVPGDEGRLAQVFRNLMINAAQSIPEGAAATNEISIAVRQEPQGYVAITVADSGCGMTAEVREHLFSPFFTTKSIGLGTGLGLSICQRIVMDLGGRIDVESEVGKGTAFRVLLPIATPDVTPAGMR